MNFSIKDIICVDLTKYTEYQISAIEKQYELKGLLSAKKDDLLKVFIDTSANEDSLVAFMISNNRYANYKGFSPTDKYAGHITKNQRKYMMNMDSINFVFVELKESLVLDDILDKISEHGIEFISENEKCFLDNLSKS